MEIIKRTTLHYQDDKSDKIYEVDLCKTKQDTYIVNFRYGRRGGKLKEETKTKDPLSLTDAEKVFTQLVTSKTKKGYQDISQPVSRKSNNTNKGNSREETILNYLENNTSNWPLDRIIWRAGELKIKAATPLLIPLINTSTHLRDYCIAWALGWCGDTTAISPLTTLYENPSTPDFVKRIAWEARMKLVDTPTQANFRQEKINSLPPELRKVTENGTVADFAEAIHSYLDQGDYQNFAVLDTIYHIDNQYTRPVLLDILRSAPFTPNYFKAIRHIFKIAEYRLDYQVFALLSYRLEHSKETYYIGSWGVAIPGGDDYVSKYKYNYNRKTYKYEIVGYPLNEEQQRANTRLAYSNKTRDYLRKRVWRTLKKLGEENHPDYINMAVSILLLYTDADDQTTKESIYYSWRKGSYITSRWDRYAAYLIFNHILYENSDRYFLAHNNRAWRCHKNYKPGDPPPNTREEAFPQLWQQHPQALLRLLLESQCQPVHEFAVKALQDCTDFYEIIDLNTIITLLQKPYEVTIDLALDLFKQHYQVDNPNLELLSILANSISSRARSQAHEWLELAKDILWENNNIITSLLISSYPDNRAFMSRLITTSHLSENKIKVLLGCILAELINFDANQAEIAEDVKSLLLNFTPQLRSLDFGVIFDLLGHPLVEIQELAANIILNHQTSAASLPPELIQALINSEHPPVRVIGMRLFAQLPDEELLQSYHLLVAMATHKQEEIRKSVKSIIHNLASKNQAFGSQLLLEFVEILLEKEPHEGVHNYLDSLIKNDLPAALSRITKKTSLKLLKAKSSVSKELGGIILKDNYVKWSSDFTTTEIVKLANHEILAVRQAGWVIFEQNLPRFLNDDQERLAAVKLLESQWDDSRKFAHSIFEQHFNQLHWTPEIMISLCDSLSEDVRKFGRDLVTSNFNPSYGQEYMLKFSEHPSADMQLFVTNYLSDYASNNPQRLEQLSPYFISVLSRVNRGRIAKDRILTFLTTEAEKNQEAAAIVAAILTRVSLTIAIGDKAKVIQGMVKIKQQYPGINLPISINQITEVR